MLCLLGIYLDLLFLNNCQMIYSFQKWFAMNFGDAADQQSKAA